MRAVLLLIISNL